MAFFSSAFFLPAAVGTIALFGTLAVIRGMVPPERFSRFVVCLTGLWLLILVCGGLLHESLVEAGAMLLVGAAAVAMGISHLNWRRHDSLND